MEKEVAIELKNISKHFNDVIANKNVNLTLYKGEILSILGENGSGKTTLMNMLSGIYQPDEGEIFINGEKAFIHSPKDAFNYHIGMVHQHFKLVDVFSAIENISLGLSRTVFDLESLTLVIKERLKDCNIIVNDVTKFVDTSLTDYWPIYVNFAMSRIKNKTIVNFTPFTGTKTKEEVLSIYKTKYEKWGIDVLDLESFFIKDNYYHIDLLNINAKIFNKHRIKYLKNRFSLNDVSIKVKEICDKYGFEIDLNKKIHNMSVSEKQTVEIVKVLYRNADILILDEPTAVLTPQEIQKLFNVLKKMREDGKSIIIITHKLNEVMEISDRVSILRKGEYITTIDTHTTNEKELTDYMVGKKVDLKLERLKILASQPCLEIRGLHVLKDDGTVAIDDLDFYLRGGQILGVAGIAGCGQKEMCEAIAGLRPFTGSITHFGKSIVGFTPEQIKQIGITMSFIPEDRLGLGLAPNLSITDNLLLKTYKDKKGILVDRKGARIEAQSLIDEYNVVTPSTETPVKNLSGGNVQKILVGREISGNPNVIITAYPVRGLDINSSYMIYDIFNKEKAKNTAILFIGEDLDVLLTFCDKIMVLCHGKNMGIVHTKNTTKEEIGLMMTGALDLTKAKPEKFGKAEDSYFTEAEWEKLKEEGAVINEESK